MVTDPKNMPRNDADWLTLTQAVEWIEKYYGIRTSPKRIGRWMNYPTEDRFGFTGRLRWRMRGRRKCTKKEWIIEFLEPRI